MGKQKPKSAAAASAASSASAAAAAEDELVTRTSALALDDADVVMKDAAAPAGGKKHQKKQAAAANPPAPAASQAAAARSDTGRERFDADEDWTVVPNTQAKGKPQATAAKAKPQPAQPRRKPSPARVEEITTDSDDDTSATVGVPQQRKAKIPVLPTKGKPNTAAPLSAMQRKTMQQRNRNGVKGLAGKPPRGGAVQVEDELIDEEELERQNRSDSDDPEEEQGPASDLDSDDDGIVWETPAQKRAKAQAAALAAAQAKLNPPSRWPSLCSLLLWTLLLLSVAGLVWMRFQDGSLFLSGASEGFDLTSSPPGEGDGDLYAVLDVPRGSSTTLKDIKAAYRRAVLVTHPDKNPGCADCTEKFQKVQRAYDVLSNAEKRQMYDSIETTYELLASEAVDLTSANFEQLVLQRDDVWLIQVYTDWHRSAIRFSPAWEEAVSRYGELVRFGRVHAQREKALARTLPVKFGVIPTVLYYANGQFVDTRAFMDSASSLGKLARWIGQVYPNTVQPVPHSLAAVKEFMGRAKHTKAAGQQEASAAVLFVPDFTKQAAAHRKQAASQIPQSGSQQQRFQQQMLQTNVNSINDPSLTLKSIARRFQYAFTFGQVQQIDKPEQWKTWIKEISSAFKLTPPASLPALLYEEFPGSAPVWLSGSELSKDKLSAHMEALHRRMVPSINSHAYARHCTDAASKHASVCVLAVACKAFPRSEAAFSSFISTARALRSVAAFKSARLQFAKVDVTRHSDMAPLCAALPSAARKADELNFVVVGDSGASMFHTRASELGGRELDSWLQHIVKADGTVPSVPAPYVPTVHIPDDVLAVQVPGYGLLQVPLRWLYLSAILLGVWMFAPLISRHMTTFLQIIFALSIAVPAFEFIKDLYAKHG